MFHYIQRLAVTSSSSLPVSQVWTGLSSLSLWPTSPVGRLRPAPAPQRTCDSFDESSLQALTLEAACRTGRLPETFL